MATIKPNKCEIGFSDQFFFDTNVWLLLYGTIADFQKDDQKAYAKFLENLISRNAPIYITSMVVSEFANVLIKKEYNSWKTNNPNISNKFKLDFVPTTQYANTVSTISILIKKIIKLPNLQLIGDDFNAIDKSNILNNFKIVDFNDAYIYQLAILNKYKIVTNDKDFQKLSSSIDIITTQC